MAHRLEQPLVLPLGQHPRLGPLPLRRDEVLGRGRGDDPLLDEEGEEGADGGDLAPAVGALQAPSVQRGEEGPQVLRSDPVDGGNRGEVPFEEGGELPQIPGVGQPGEGRQVAPGQVDDPVEHQGPVDRQRRGLGRHQMYAQYSTPPATGSPNAPPLYLRRTLKGHPGS